ncbi:MAG TPA: TraR/DksA family transcriptional regulator [Gemmatimonadaceae bacterium]|nr:TraR/DksA family transcriptional regulator [Gemmatimonadaceae bacterium]
MSSTQSLTTSQLRDLEAELRRERARLERVVRSQAQSGGEGDPDGSSAYDVSSLGAAPGIGLTTQARARLEAIDAALARIADGSYGICSGCGARIPFGRLIVMPESALCMACGRV